MANRKPNKEQETLEDAPTGNGKYGKFQSLRSGSNVNEEPQMLEKQSTFSRISKSVFNYSISTKNNDLSSTSFSQNRSPRHGGAISRSGSRAAPLKIEELFDTHFSRSPDELLQILEQRQTTPTSSSRNRGGNVETMTTEDLRAILRTVIDEIGSLKHKCMAVESRYKEATITASRELQDSMNILFKLQQKTATLEDSSKTVDRLSHDLKYKKILPVDSSHASSPLLLRRVIKVRLAEKEKECRWATSEGQVKDRKIQEQANEIKELSAMVGGTSLDLAKQAEEARRANLLAEEVKSVSHSPPRLTLCFSETSPRR
jgi:predicted outer membrane repeat protein